MGLQEALVVDVGLQEALGVDVGLQEALGLDVRLQEALDVGLQAISVTGFGGGGGLIPLGDGGEGKCCSCVTRTGSRH